MPGFLLSIDRLDVDFHARRGVVRVIEGVSLDIARGEILAVVGESGAGKSVTGSAVLGLMEPSAVIAGGSIVYDHRRIDTLPAEETRALRGREIAAIFQDPMSSLDPLLRVGDQLVETIRHHIPMPRAAAMKRARALLVEVGIADPDARLRQYPHEFSGGMRQRVVIALALCGEPRLLIADEPTTALDARTQAQIVALLARLRHERGMAVMLITHDIGIVAAIADRVAVMYAGRVVESGPAEAVLGAPLHPYTRGLIAAVPTLAARTRRLTQIPGSMPPVGARPAGCAFAPRCPSARARCETPPPLFPAGEGRHSRCWLSGDGTLFHAA